MRPACSPAWVFPFLLGQRIKEARLAARRITLAVSRSCRESCLSPGLQYLERSFSFFFSVSEFFEFSFAWASPEKSAHDAGLRLVATR